MIPRSVDDSDPDGRETTTKPDLPRYRPLESLVDEIDATETLLGIYTLLRTLVFLVVFHGLFELGTWIWNVLR